MTMDAERLLALLPAFYRERDAGEGEPLRALLAVIAEQGAVVEQDIARLYDNWFIETCDHWLVPYIGDLLGVRGLHALTASGGHSPRALVANTLRLRRRKGTVAALEQVAQDASGWRARALEFFQQLATSQHLNHLGRQSLVTTDIRRPLAMERLGSAFDQSFRLGEVRPLPAGRYNIANLGIFIWRLQSYSLRLARAQPASGEPGRYHIDPLGRGPADIGVDPASGGAMLYNRPRTETDISSLAEPHHLPEPLSRWRLHAELAGVRQALADGHSLPLRYFAATDGGPALQIWLDGEPVEPENLLICDLSPLPGVVPEQWQRPPASLVVSSSDGSSSLSFPRQPGQLLVGLDPVLGRIALPLAAAVSRVEISYAYAFAGDIGGGPYDRRPLLASDEAASGLYTSEDFDQLLRVPEDQPTLAAALGQINLGSRVLIRLNHDQPEVLSPLLSLDDTQLAIEAVNQRRPVLVGDWTVSGNGNTRLSLSGLLVAGQLKLDGPLAALELRHSTLVPAHGGISHSGNGASFSIRLTRSICGPLSATRPLAAVIIDHSIIDGAGQPALSLPDSALTIDRSTLAGTVDVGQLDASNSLFVDEVKVARRQQGCVRFCYLPLKSQTPRRYRCQPDLAVSGLPAALAQNELARISPAFTSSHYGHPAYFQLRRTTASELLSGAEDGAEIGVWNLLQQPQREANLRTALEEYLRFGLEAGVIFVN